MIHWDNEIIKPDELLLDNTNWENENKPRIIEFSDNYINEYEKYVRILKRKFSFFLSSGHNSSLYKWNIII